MWCVPCKEYFCLEESIIRNTFINYNVEWTMPRVNNIKYIILYNKKNENCKAAIQKDITKLTVYF